MESDLCVAIGTTKRVKECGCGWGGGVERMSKGDASYGMLHSHFLKTVIFCFVFPSRICFYFCVCVCEFVCNIPVKFF